jgi:uncharacterized protein YprB with RNaseH-like and TPR domain
MSAPADRIRRILADAGPALRRASDVPAPAADAGDDPLRRRLRERLEALRAAESRRAVEVDPDLPVPPPFVEPPDDGRTLEERLGAVVRSGGRGGFLQVERRWPLSARHGEVVLGEVLDRSIPLRPRERRPGGRASVAAGEAVFLDVETTGLSGGTGTIAFLIGAGRVEGSDFVVRQYFLRDFPDEPAALEALAGDLGDAPLVTFNGRTFDWPLLATRLRIHRTPCGDRDHVDLLPPSRRLWAGSLDSHALGELERRVLGIVRGDDLPGYLIPAAWFAWLRTGRSAALALAFRHNEVDIVSMVALAARMARVMESPWDRPGATGLDHLGTAALLLQHGDAARARACLEAAAEAGLGTETPALWRTLGGLQRRAGDLEAAARTWRRWLAEGGEFDAHPFEALAKVEEHRRRDYPAALSIVEDALGRCPRGHHARRGLEHRAARLRRRLARRPAPARP